MAEAKKSFTLSQSEVSQLVGCAKLKETSLRRAVKASANVAVQEALTKEVVELESICVYLQTGGKA